MDTAKLRKMKREDLEKRLQEKKGELLEYISDVRQGKERNYAKSSDLKKEIARIHTIMKEGSYEGGNSKNVEKDVE